MKTYIVDIKGEKVELPIVRVSEKLSIALLNLHGKAKLTNHFAKCLAPSFADCDVIITAETKGLQLCHAIATILGHDRYVVLRKSKKPYMQNVLEEEIGSTVTTGAKQMLYMEGEDAEFIKGKKVGFVDDVISTGVSFFGAKRLIEKAVAIVHKAGFCLAEDDAKNFKDIFYLAEIPLFFD